MASFVLVDDAKFRFTQRKLPDKCPKAIFGDFFKLTRRDAKFCVSTCQFKKNGWPFDQPFFKRKM